ncbi:MAG: hypothetical protein AAF564_25470 [Bacteroidota bacterium]
MKSFVLALVMATVFSACNNDADLVPYPIPGQTAEEGRLYFPMPANELGNYLTNAPIREVSIMREAQSGEIRHEQWLVYNIEQPGLKPDFELLLVVEQDTVRTFRAWGRLWYDRLSTEREEITEILNQRQAFLESEGTSVTLPDLISGLEIR